MSNIGPSFPTQLAIAGLLGLPFSWTPSGTILYASGVTNDQKTAIAALIAAHDPSLPDPSAACTALLVAGMALTSSGTSALDGIYPCDPTSQQRIVAEALSIQVAGKFTNGQTTRAWYDTSNAGHTFDTTQFTAFSEAVGQFVDAALVALEVGLTTAVWAAPSNAYTIA